MIKKIISLAVISLCAGCMTTLPQSQDTRISTKMFLSEHNSITGKYHMKKAFATLKQYPKGEYKDFIHYSADRYGQGELWVAVPKQEVPKVVNGLKKYLEWNKQAIANKDMFEKEIMQYEAAYNSYGTTDVYNSILFFSGNETSHYAIFQQCMNLSAIGLQCNTAAVIDAENAKTLITELEMYGEGKMINEDISSKYN